MESTAGHTASGYAEALLQRLLAVDRAGVEAVTDRALREGMGSLELYEQVYRPALYRVGELWAQGQISVSAEHIATALIEAEMARLLPLVLSRRRVGRTVLVAATPGESHRVATRMVADAFEACGWDAEEAPEGAVQREIVALVERLQPDVVALSSTLPTHRAVLGRVMAALALAFPEVALLVGGQALRDLEPAEMPQGPRVCVVQDLVSLMAVIAVWTEDPLATAPHAEGSLSGAVEPAEMGDWIASVDGLSRVPRSAVDALDAALHAVAGLATAPMVRRADARELLGPSGQPKLAEDNEFLLGVVVSWLRRPIAAVLVRTVQWAADSHARRGYAPTYWSAQRQAWDEACSELLREVDRAALAPVLDWMCTTAELAARRRL
jgi:methanogenic corrinoid protein MtbC1